MCWFSSPNPCIRDWSGKSVWIVGASQGIGRAFAQQLDEQGAQLIISGRDSEALHRLSQSLSTPALVYPLDIQQPNAISAYLDNLNRPIELMIIFAGAYSPDALLKQDQETVTQMLHTNLMGVIYASQAITRVFARQGQGHLVIVGSAAAYLPMPYASVYGATKAGLAYFARSLYTELRPLNVAVSLVSPGFVDTRLTRKNTFKMPNLLTSEQAARAIILGLAKGTFAIDFPLSLTLTMRLLNRLPWFLLQPILNAMLKKESSR